MSIVACLECETEWAASVQPCCPSCLVESWLASPHLVTDKHDPRRADQVRDDYRSVLAEHVLTNLRAVLEDAVATGTWYYNAEYEKFNHVTRLPLQQKPGSGVKSGNARPDRRLEDLVVADADQDPHVFADDRKETRRKLASGIYRPLETCGRSKCDNLCPPRSRRCVIHSNPPLAARSSR